ncbi:hypothetical protein ACFPZ0_06065 [Streptomonospora nanhaiensis]|uniref:Chromosome segregation ATPase n=1 Tax=Streptomonospora nanhaiensis TaxID=1323731 RepID=A0A853BKL4_9ACTN|nr:hypothetical protein [Streptomonospora nanhaiensis]MBV2363201.1 hypothetical protein [Streptomonospora nanhaiensis]MBX9390084.1 hypothetical protein [Streptomonospora nanhaiensis]NYI95560.1 chromosome segregation ATPase [Streptomonospora nanhaiensis]
MWFVGTGRGGRAAQIHGIAARLRKVQREADEREAALIGLERVHTDIQRQVQRAEEELAELRRRRIEAYSRWWAVREERDRARHVARRLRRRLERLHHRPRPFGG